MIRFLVVAAFVLSVSGCRCGPVTSGNGLPEVVANPTALRFEACPTLDDKGMKVADVFPDEQKVALTNVSKTGTKLTFTIGGTDKDAFKLDAMRTPANIDAQGEQSLPVQFSPLRKGDATGELVIADDNAETADVKVTLTGTGSALAAQPTLEVATQNKDVLTQYNTCLEGVTCAQDFPDTLYKESTVMEIKLRNKGCPALKITSMELVSIGSGDLAFFVQEPATVPTASAPLVFTSADGTSERTIKIRFAPQNDNSGNPARFAYLRLKTNDPNVSDSDGTKGNLDIGVQGVAIEPSIYTTPSRCGFNDLNPVDNCGNDPKIANKAKFLIKNSGNVQVKIDSTLFKSSGAESSLGGRFSVATSVVGQTVMPGASLELNVNHDEKALYVQDQLIISASIMSGAAGSAGRAVVAVTGGKKPCLSTEPALDPMTHQAILNFMDPQTELSAKTVTIKNGPAATCGDLVLNKVSINANPFFSLLDPKIADKSTVLPGGSLEATVQYKKPVSGGTQVGTLVIDSNDTDFSDPVQQVHYTVELRNTSALDELPVAIVEGCVFSDPMCAAGKQVAMSVKLSDLNANKELFMSGKKSYDPPGTTKAVSNYLFRLVRPSGPNTSTLENEGVKDPKAIVKLTLDPAATGIYRVTLQVFDDKNQISGASTELKLSVSP